MTEVNTKSIVINAGSNTYKITSMNFDDICSEIGVTAQVFTEMLSRDFYAPQLQQAPTSTTLYYNDPSKGSQTAFKVGQCCVYPDSESADGYGISMVKHIATNYQGNPSSIVWQKFSDDSSMGKQAVYELFGLSV